MTEELKQAAQQALEALEHAEKDAADFQRLNTDQTSVAIKSLRQALTQRPAAQAGEREAWHLINPAGQVVATERTAVKAFARIDGYKPTVEGLLGYEEKGWRVLPASLPTQPAAQTDAKPDLSGHDAFDVLSQGCPTHPADCRCEWCKGKPAAQATQSDLDRRYSEGWNDCLSHYVNRPTAMAVAHKAMFPDQRATPSREVREAEQRARMQARLADRPASRATADFDLPAPNDATQQATPEPEWRDRLTVNLLRQGSGLTKNQIRALIDYAVDGIEPDAALFSATPEPVGDVRCEGCGYMTHHREHMGCVRAAKQHTRPAPGVPEGFTLDQIADACVQAEISDSKFESLSIALAAAQAKGGAA